MSKAASSAAASGAGGKGGFGGSLGKAFKNKVNTQMLVSNISKTTNGIEVGGVSSYLTDVQEQ